MPATIKDHVFAKVVVKMHYATKDQVMECIEARNLSTQAGQKAPKLWDIMIQKGYLTKPQLQSILQGVKKKDKSQFGEIAVRWHMVSPVQVKNALARQKTLQKSGKSTPRIGQILVEQGYLKKHQVIAILEEQKKRIARCPTCKAQFNVRRVDEGQRFRCTQCGKVLQMQGNQASTNLSADSTMVEAKKAKPEVKKAATKTQSKFGPYKILKKLGSDSTGTIYKAMHKDDDQNLVVTLKVLAAEVVEDRQYIAELRQQVERSKTLNHPNIQRTYGLGQADGSVYIATEFIEGESLRAILLRDGKIGIRKSMKIGSYVAQALEYAVQQGVMHGDVRPSNILISTRGQVVLSGIGVFAKTSDNILNIVDSGHLAPFYIAPEHVLEDRETDFRSDIYSLGVTLYHIIAGRPPFEGQSPFEVLVRLTEDYLPPLAVYNPGTPECVNRVIEKMIQAEPDDRYQDFHRLIQHLDDPNLALPSGHVTTDARPGEAPKMLELGGETQLEGLARGAQAKFPPGKVAMAFGLILLASFLAYRNLFGGGGGWSGTDGDAFAQWKIEFLREQYTMEGLERCQRKLDSLRSLYARDTQILSEIDRKTLVLKDRRKDIFEKQRRRMHNNIQEFLSQNRFAEALQKLEASENKGSQSAWKEAIRIQKQQVLNEARNVFESFKKKADQASMEKNFSESIRLMEWVVENVKVGGIPSQAQAVKGRYLTLKKGHQEDLSSQQAENSQAVLEKCKNELIPYVGGLDFDVALRHASRYLSKLQPEQKKLLESRIRDFQVMKGLKNLLVQSIRIGVRDPDVASRPFLKKDGKSIPILQVDGRQIRLKEGGHVLAFTEVVPGEIVRLIDRYMPDRAKNKNGIHALVAYCLLKKHYLKAFQLLEELRRLDPAMNSPYFVRIPQLQKKIEDEIGLSVSAIQAHLSAKRWKQAYVRCLDVRERYGSDESYFIAYRNDLEQSMDDAVKGYLGGGKISLAERFDGTLGSDGRSPKGWTASRHIKGAEVLVAQGHLELLNAWVSVEQKNIQKLAVRLILPEEPASLRLMLGRTQIELDRTGITVDLKRVKMLVDEKKVAWNPLRVGEEVLLILERLSPTEVRIMIDMEDAQTSRLSIRDTWDGVKIQARGRLGRVRISSVLIP